MSTMFEFCHLGCEYVELHAPLSFGLDELSVKGSRKLVTAIYSITSLVEMLSFTIIILLVAYMYALFSYSFSFDPSL